MTQAGSSPSWAAGRPATVWVSALGILLLLVAAKTGNPVLLLLSLTAATAVLLHRALAWDLAVVAASMAMTFTAIAAGTAADVTGVDLLAKPRLLMAGYVVFVLGAAMTAARAPRRVESGSLDVRRSVLWWPAAAGAAIAVVQGGSTRVTASWALQGTDLAQHVVLLGDLQRVGSLGYTDEVYPRGLHMLLALVAAPSAPDARAELLVHDLRMIAGATWLCLALLVLAAVSVVRRVAVSTGMSRWLALGTATALGTLLLLSNAVLETFVYMGAAPSLLAVVVLWSVPLLALEAEGQPPVHALLLTGAVATGLLAHLWQPLLVVPVVAVAFCLLRHPGLRGRTLALRSRRGSGPALLLSALAAAVTAPAVLGVLAGGGSDIAAIPGEIRPVPVAVLVLGGLYLLAGRRCRAAVPGMAGTAAGLLLVTAVLLRSAGGGWDLSQYYPMKALWFLALLLAPLAAVTGAVLLGWLFPRAADLLARLGSAAAVARICTVATVVALAGAFVLPQIVASRSSALGTVRALWDEGHADAGLAQISLAQEQATRYTPAVTMPVAVGESVIFDAYASYVLSKLLSFQTGQEQTHGRPPTACADVADVAEGRDVVVITKLDPALLAPFLRDGGCGDVRIVQIPGGIRDAQFLEQLISAAPAGTAA